MKSAVFLTVMLFGMFYESVYADENEIVSYIEAFRKTMHSDSYAEQRIMSLPLEQFLNQMTGYYVDSMVFIRQKAYHLTFRKGIESEIDIERKLIIKRLLHNGFNDSDAGIKGLILRYLQQFSRADFDDECRSFIAEKIVQTRATHYRELVLLAGYINAGNVEMYTLLADTELPQRYRWYVSLALARMGDDERAEYCVNMLKRLPVNSDLTDYFLPDIIFTRHRAAIDYCVELIFSDEKLCETQNPDISEKISCAWKVIPMLVNVIADFPVEIDASGEIVGDYQKAIQDLREWLTENKDYKILDTTF